MKKFLLSAFVLGVFFVYALHIKVGSDEGNQVIAIRTPNPTIPPQNTPAASNGPTPLGSPQPTAQAARGKYKDGTYTGSVADAFYGNIQVQAVISGGRLTDVIFLQAPNDRGTSIAINAQADPLLKQEAIQAQSAQVSGVSGASASSGAFVQSLGDALQQALN